ncbi:acyltransferase family protein [Lutibacter sp. B1]|uniref:acyltransferase family protein n=1 Tax=Lutibacter sp. B1 TaxID=2725996 RepID=UPI00145758E1|nr:acyltransferase family protein [Lutibacter sp. B1]NLP56641.1 acyltransferase [Lutibacter sp. B1]
MSGSIRRYDIDWLRVIAIGLLLIYHITIVFQPWGVFIGFIQSDKPLNSLWIPMSMLNVWRIPLLFFVSGMGVCFAIKKRNWKQLITERSRRILLPFIFGIFFIVPIHFLIWQFYYSQDVSYVLNRSHLWFLGNIFVYVLVLSPLFFYLKRIEGSLLGNKIKKLFGNPLGFLLILTSFVIETFIVKIESFELYAMTSHGFFLGLLAFLFGFLLIFSETYFWNSVLKWRWVLVIVASLLFSVRLFYFELVNAPNYLKAVESCFWVFTVFAFGYRYLNHQSKTLSYLSQGAYPIYIVHMIFLFLGSYLIIPLNIPTILKFILLIVFTIIGCFALYEFIIKRVKILRLFFGLKNEYSNTHLLNKLRINFNNN